MEASATPIVPVQGAPIASTRRTRPPFTRWIEAKKLGVPARDAQIILGHSRLAVTLEIYTHEDRQAQREALGKISDVLRRDGQKGQ
jgi:integrase